MTIRWRLYGQDCTVSSDQMAWADVKSLGVLAVVWQGTDGPVECELGAPWYYHGPGWIRRVWDPTLYLRQLGTVKFGRWTSAEEFWGAWEVAVQSICRTPEEFAHANPREHNGGQVVVTEDAETAKPKPAWWAYYEGKRLFTADQYRWEEIPSDGILACCYRRMVDGIAFTCAKRRHTYYYWAGEDLVNSDDLDDVMKFHPQFKRGRTTFDGLKAVQPMAEDLAKALADTLENVPWPT